MFVCLLLTLLAVLAWIYLLLERHGFWRATPLLECYSGMTEDAPPVAVIIPARDEALTIETAVRSLLAQDYKGRLDVIVVDDQSRDQTAAIVQTLVPDVLPSRSLELIGNSDRPAGWSGKLWAIKTGLDYLTTRTEPPTILLLTDADIAHDSGNLSGLIKKMVNERADLVSVMVRLRNQSFWERLLIPPFAFLTWPFHQENILGATGLAGWLMMAFAILPTIKLYRASMLWAPVLPFAALRYTAMTIDSARRYRQGKGGVWKGRAFQA